MTPKTQPTSDKLNNWIRSSITLRMITIGFLILILLIPVVMIKDLIQEREQRRESAIWEVSSKWGTTQTITGPVLTVPYLAYYREKDEKGKETIIKRTEYAHFLPDELNISGDISPEILYRGIYEIVVYNTKLKVEGSMLSPDFEDWSIAERDIIWEDAFISIGIPDLKGIQENIEIKWNDGKYSFNPGIETENHIVNSGVSVRIPVDYKDNAKKDNTFSFEIDLNGSSGLYFVPLGRVTNVRLTSNWSNPSFDGAFLPDKREVSKDGFNASWKVLHLNRNFPQKWRMSASNVYESAFGVNLLLPVDQYQKSMRCAKYAVMFIALTFLVFFFVEILNKKRIHPIQYILVGLGLCIFYTLLLSLSEYITFNLAYLIAGLAVIVLISAYAKSMFKSNLLTALMGLILIILYGFIFTIIQLQDYALLLGSIGLFIVLAVVMYLSRRISWYSAESNNADTVK